MKNKVNILAIIFLFPLLVLMGQVKRDIFKMPERGICAHRGAMDTHHENTLSAFEEAIRLGAHMIEFDERMTKDKKLIIMHDRTVDRTTNGNGLVAVLTLEEIKNLDAGNWKSKEFFGEKVPTLKEALSVMPKNIWLNIHFKGGEELGSATAKVFSWTHKGVIACGFDAAQGVKKVNSNILICNMERQGSRIEYVDETIQGEYSFIQLLKKRNDTDLQDDINRLMSSKIKINYYFGDTVEEVKDLFEQFKGHFVIFDLTVSYLIGKEQRMHIYAEAKNMFEVKYQTHHDYADNGRMVSASLNSKLLNNTKLCFS